MSKVTVLEKNAKELKKCILKEFGKTDKDIEKYIVMIKDWIKSQPHLPEVPGDNKILQFLLCSKFSLEKTKPVIDMYYTLRGIYPEKFKNPSLPEMEAMGKFLYCFPFPKMTPDCRRIFFATFDCDVDVFDYDNFCSYCTNSMEIMMNEDSSMGLHVIFDCKGVKLNHVSKVSLIDLKKTAIIMQKGFSTRIASLHLINAPSYLDTFVSLVKSILLPAKLSERVQIHRTNDALPKYFPKDILPEDFGGKELSLSALNDLWTKKISEHRGWFDKRDICKIDESLRPTPLVNDEILGYHGSFRKLDVD